MSRGRDPLVLVLSSTDSKADRADGTDPRQLAGHGTLGRAVNLEGFAVALGVDIGIAKVAKYAVRDSGDTVEVVERPGGGISVVLVDGQGSGAAAKALSHL